MGRGTLRGATREGEASKVKGRFWGGHPKKVFVLFYEKFVWRGTGKAETRRAAGRR